MNLCKLLLSLLLGGLLFGAGGCQVLAAAADKLGPEPTDPAAYVPEKDNLLVLVESYHNPSSVEVIAEHIDRLIAAELIYYKVAPIINPDRLTVVRHANETTYRQMKLYDIGRQVSARQVLYVDITAFDIESAVGTEALKGHAEAHVKIVDCITGQTRWPRDATQEGYPVVVEIPFAADAQNNSEVVVREALARELSGHIAKLLYAHASGQASDAPSYPETDTQ
ncbi:MAG TPA: hypothetical protein VG326_06920 [Tepidisphaeraceae bacterium]|jgi:hypothetical protein|nr:hypothetical protein [Tepidisphaeraceae bacterium]